MKGTLFSILLVSGIALSAWYYQEQKEPICIEDWYAQTQSVFSGASQFFANFQSNNDASIEELDAKLQELLPSNELDLSYRPDSLSLTDSHVLQTASAPQLPNLFGEPVSTSDDGTQLKGQVHMDEDDNIIGAEVEVAIPTNL